VLDLGTPGPSLDALTHTAHTIIFGTFEGYGQSFWNTPDGGEPAEADVDAGRAEIRTSVSAGVWSAIRGDESVLSQAVLLGSGRIGCSEFRTDRYPAFVGTNPSTGIGELYVFFFAPAIDSVGTRTDDHGLIAAWPVDEEHRVLTPRDGTIAMDDLRNLIAAVPGPEATPLPTPPIAPAVPADLRAAVENRLHVFDSDADNAWFVSRWPYSRAGATRIPFGYSWYVGGLTVGLLKTIASGTEVAILDLETGEPRKLGDFPATGDNVSGVVDPTGSVFYVHGSSGDNDRCAGDCVDHGVVAFDVASGAQSVVVPPRDEVVGRWNMEISPSGASLMSVASVREGDYLLLELVDLATGAVTAAGDELFEQLDVQAMTSTHLFGIDAVTDPATGSAFDRRVAVSPFDGTTIVVPSRYGDPFGGGCGDCSMAAPPAYALDEHRFVFDRAAGEHYEVFVLDTRSGKVARIYGWDEADTTPADQLMLAYGVLRSRWVLLAADFGPGEHIYALDVRDGSVTDLGAAP
jgi:hypothetical protein